MMRISFKKGVENQVLFFIRFLMILGWFWGGFWEYFGYRKQFKTYLYLALFTKPFFKVFGSILAGFWVPKWWGRSEGETSFSALASFGFPLGLPGPPFGLPLASLGLSLASFWHLFRPHWPPRGLPWPPFGLHFASLLPSHGLSLACVGLPWPARGFPVVLIIIIMVMIMIIIIIKII